MAVAQLSASLCLSVHGAYAVNSARRTHIAICRLPTSSFAKIGTSFATGFPLSISRIPLQRTHASKTSLVSVRCEQSTGEGNSLDVWLGRFAMVGFVVAITVEIATGKGLLENFGLTTPLPAVALAVTGLVGVLAAVFIFQSASKN